MKTALKTEIIFKDICEGFVYNELGDKGLSGELITQHEYSGKRN